MSEFKAEMTAAECVESNMGIYAGYTLATKLPNSLDGLKPIHRRILWTLHQKPDYQKEATLAGRVMEMHPHGDASISAAISSMAQPFTHILPLVYSESNIGTYVGDAPAAARYVDVKESDAARDLFFNDINRRMFRMVPCESENGSEPANFIPRIPTALMIPVLGIAIGFKTETVACAIMDLCHLTIEYIKLRSGNVDWATKTRQLVKYMLPDFPTSCILRNKSELLSEYRAGNFNAPILIDGIMQVKNDQIIFENLPPGKAFNNATIAVGKMTRDKSSWESQNFQQMEDFSGKKQGIMHGNFTCILRRGLNPFDVLSRLKKEVQFTSYWKPDRKYVDSDGNMSSETPLTLLDKWYTVRYNAVLGDLKQTLKDLVDKKRKLLALIKVVDYTDEVYQIFKNAETPEDTIGPLCKRFDLTKQQAQYLSELTLGQITSRGKKELEQERDKVDAQMVELQEKFSKVNELMIESIERFEKKYASSCERRCSIPKYIGTACYKDNGWIMLESESEMDKIISDFGDPDNIEFDLCGGDLEAIAPDEELYGGDLPKYLKAGYVGQILPAHKYTACVCNKGGALVLEGHYPKQENMCQAIPVAKTFSAVLKQGHVTNIDITDKIMRKSASAGPTMKDVLYVSPTVIDDAIVIHGNSSQPNYLVVERVTNGQKLRKIVVGSWHILAIVPANTAKIIVNIPKEIRQRCAVRHLVFENLDKVIEPNSYAGCLFGRGPGTLKSAFDISPIRRKSTIMLAKPKS